MPSQDNEGPNPLRSGSPICPAPKWAGYMVRKSGSVNRTKNNGVKRNVAFTWLFNQVESSCPS